MEKIDWNTTNSVYVLVNLDGKIGNEYICINSEKLQIGILGLLETTVYSNLAYDDYDKVEYVSYLFKYGDTVPNIHYSKNEDYQYISYFEPPNKAQFINMNNNFTLKDLLDHLFEQFPNKNIYIKSLSSLNTEKNFLGHKCVFNSTTADKSSGARFIKDKRSSVRFVKNIKLNDQLVKSERYFMGNLEYYSLKSLLENSDDFEKKSLEDFLKEYTYDNESLDKKVEEIKILVKGITDNYTKKFNKFKCVFISKVDGKIKVYNSCKMIKKTYTIIDLYIGLKTGRGGNIRTSITKVPEESIILNIPNVIEVLGKLGDNPMILNLKKGLEDKLKKPNYVLINVHHLCALSLLVNNIIKEDGKLNYQKLDMFLIPFPHINKQTRDILYIFKCLQKDDPVKIQECQNSLDSSSAAILLASFGVIKHRFESKFN